MEDILNFLKDNWTFISDTIYGLLCGGVGASIIVIKNKLNKKKEEGK